MKTAAKTLDLLRVIGRGGPALCNVAVTNACNAACDFCGFARGKVGARNLRWIDADRFDQALDILHKRDIRYISFFGGETLMHPRLTDMISLAVGRGMGCAVITNGWFLPAKLDALAASGLKNVYVSIDAATIAEHENNRGLKGLGKRILSATERMPGLGMTPIAQVTMNKMIRDYRALTKLLGELGFQAVAFSYPQKARLGSTTLAWSSQSLLVDFSDDELVEAFDAVDDARKVFPVNNPRASVADMKRHLLGQKERFVCYAGYKSFYMDWNYDIWRCDAWDKRMCSVWDFADTPFIRDGCTACIADCYRDSSVMLHFAISLGDAAKQLAQGHFLAAARVFFDSRNAASLRAVAENAQILSRVGKLG
jgi:MoaA/NifB/PqqE/SkfB family radical SAM enzyme